MENVIFSRAWCMPSADTFSMLPVSRLLDRWLADRDVVVDPFARNSKRGTLTNDLNPNTYAQCHTTAEDFVTEISVAVDAVLFDPPYSPRQVSEIYQSIGREVTQKDTQGSFFSVRDRLAEILKINGIAICCGWNSQGFGMKRGFTLREILLVAHGGAHNDTIVTVETKDDPNAGDLF